MLIGFPVPGKKKSADLVAAFITGAPKDARGAVFYGVTEGNVAAWRAARAATAHGDDFYYIDNSYFDCVRSEQFRVTKNAIQHPGAGESDGKRFAKLALEVEHYRAPKGYVLVVPQSDVFMQLVVRAPFDWSAAIARQFAHEPAVKWRPWSSDKLAIQKTLRQDLEGAKLLVTHSSAAAVSAVLMGVRVSVSPMSCAHCFSDKEVSSDAKRWQWASVLADNQWTVDEFRDGTAWSMLNGR
jgi:hypothetical protein